MLILRTVNEVREVIEKWRLGGSAIALVPTMGNLHEGHIALLKEAGRLADKVAVSIFVNELQFDRKDDFDSYPRTEAADFEVLSQHDAALVFAPSSDEVYPSNENSENYARQDAIRLGSIAQDLCGKHRPGHFQGVVLAVRRLLDIFVPDVAVFGEKDYQQQLLIKQAAKQFDFKGRIVSVATVREADGLALSSRNARLNPTQRSIAPLLHQVLAEAAESLRIGERHFAELSGQARQRLEHAGFRLDYFEIRTIDLGLPTEEDAEFVVLAAAWLGPVRLIDNVCAKSQKA